MIYYKRRYQEADFDAIQAIKDLIETEWSKDPNEKGKVVALLKGLIFSDDSKAQKFIAKLDELTSGLDEKDFV